MKHYNYIFVDGIVSLLVIIGFIYFIIGFVNIYNDQIIHLIFFIIISAFIIILCCNRLVSVIKLFIDIKRGVKEKQVIFLGTLNELHVDVSSKIKYSIIYFEDDIMSKDYKVFDDVEHENIERGDLLMIKYFELSRIVTEIELCKAPSSINSDSD